MPYGEYAQCPCCNKTAYGKDEIEEKFGYRNMGMDELYHSRIVELVAQLVVKQERYVR